MELPKYLVFNVYRFYINKLNFLFFILQKSSKNLHLLAIQFIKLLLRNLTKIDKH